MNKTALVIQREYLARVKKKSFVWTTILVPIVIVGFYAAMIAIGVSGGGESSKIGVIDKANLFEGKADKASGDKAEYVFINNETPESFKEKYVKEGYNYFLYIPPFDINKKTDSITLYSQSTISIAQKSRIEKTINKAIEIKRLQSANISPEQYRSIKSEVSVENITGKEEKKGVAGVAAAVSFALGMLIYVVLLIYGTMVMRGVMEEKISRVAEVVVSSVKPFQLMLGKIIGIGAVGLTQFAIWIALIIGLNLIIPIVMPDLATQLTGQEVPSGSSGVIVEIASGLKTLPMGLIIFCFIFYFLGGYLLYASLFAAVGSVVSDDQQDAQQLILPIMMPIVLGIVIMSKAIAEPNSGLAVFGSLFPLTSPVVMMGRIMFDIPVYELVISMVLLVLTFLFLTWLTAKIYRTGILLYGKKVTWKEMMKWAFRKS